MTKLNKAIPAYRRNGHNNLNFGDILTAFLIEQLTRQNAIWTLPENKTPHYMVTGSILSVANTFSKVRGCGFINNQEKLTAQPEISAVRGPLTRSKVLEQGFECPANYGDPALLLPKIYFPQIKKKYQIGFIAHHSEFEAIQKTYNNKEILLISPLDPIPKIIDQICSCEHIISSSLHGLVLGHAYGIPSLRVEKDKILDDTFKYHDYLLSVGIKIYKPIIIDIKKDSSEVLLELFENNPNAVAKNIDLDGLIEVCPFLDNEEKKYWKNKKIKARKNKKLALVMIVRNEEKHISKALENAGVFSNEIIIADTGSEDKTLEITQKFTDNIFQFERSDDFSAARNFVIRNCFAKFCILMDADDVIHIKDAQKIKQLMQNKIDRDIASLPYHWTKNQKGETTTIIQKECILRNKVGIFFHYPVHEHLCIDKQFIVKHLDNISIHHENIHRRQSSNKRNILIIEKAISTEEYKKDSFLRRYLGRELSLGGNITPAIKAYKQAIIYNTKEKTYKLSLQYFELGKLFKLNGDNNSALAYFAKAAETFDFYREPFWEIGNIYLEQNQQEEAKKIFEIALNIPYPKGLDVPDLLLYTSDIVQNKKNK